MAMTELDFLFLLYLADTPLWEKAVIEEVIAEEREETQIERLLTIWRE